MSIDLAIYLVTDLDATRGRPLEGVVEDCLEGGVRAVQLRAKTLGTRPLLDVARALRRLTAAHGAHLLINERVDVALAVGADGVHLPADGLPVEAARGLVGPGRLIGVSAHSLAEAESAASAGADFVVFGPVYDTPSKERYGRPLGVDALAQVCRRVSVPVVGIGGITAERASGLRQRGAAGVGVVRALLGAEEPCRAALDLRAAWAAG